MCGKNLCYAEKAALTPGSPPRVREKPDGIEEGGKSRRITPACAGKTISDTSLFILSRDHPRVCGKNTVIDAITNDVMGSPPRVREKLSWFSEDVLTAGITPACAGKTFSATEAFCLTRDHPRVCGKNDAITGWGKSRVGSPPRVREKQGNTLPGYPHLRITPACAGKTFQLLQPHSII